MDKFPDIFRATIAVFHGIIATWIFIEFVETTVSEFQFVILIVFFAVANILVWNFLRIAYYRLWAKTAPQLAASDFASLTYTPIDVAALTAISIAVGLGSAIVYRTDVILSAANFMTDFRRTHSDAPFALIVSHIAADKMSHLDGRDRSEFKNTGGKPYLRVYVKDMKFAYEGYPSVRPNRLDPREVMLSPACRYFDDKSQPTAKIEGPGVFIKLAEAVSFEIIDANKSPCAALQPKS